MSATLAWAGRFPRLRSCLVLTLLGVLTGAAAVNAQQVSPARPQTALPAAGATEEAATELQAIPLEIDVGQLLAAGELWRGTYQASIWTFTAAEGRQLLVLPLRLATDRQAYTVTTSTIRLRGAKLIAYELVLPRQEEGSARRDGNAGNASGGGGGGGEVVAPPLVARSFTVTPDGRVQWKLERSIVGGTLVPPTDQAGLNPYLLKLQPQLLEQRTPAAPARITREANESARDYQNRVTAASETARQQIKDFNELRRRVNSLPTEFEMPLPAQVLAVFDVRAGTSVLELTGPPPLPWSLSLADLQTLAGVGGSGRGAEGGLSEETLSLMQRMMRAQPVAYQFRLLATTLSTLNPATVGQELRSGVLALLKQLLACPDVAARHTAIEVTANFAAAPNGAGAGGAAGADPSVVEMLAKAREDADPVNKLLALGGWMRVNGGDQAALKQGVEMANRLLASGAPGAERVLTTLLDVAAGLPQANNTTAPPQELVKDVALAQIPAGQRDAAIATVALAAPGRMLASMWLDRHLLGSADGAWARRTLEILRALPAPAAAEQSNVLGDENPGAAAAARGLIPLSTAEHGIFKLLGSPDPAVSGLAWEVIGRFLIVANESVYGEAGAQTAISRAVARAAGKVTPLPAQVVDLLVRQRDPENRAACIFLLLASGDPAARGGIIDMLAGPDVPVTTAFATLTADDRQAVAGGYYRAFGEPAPKVIGLLRAGGSAPIVEWFARQVTRGSLPTVAGWALAAGETSALLEWAAAEDRVLAQGAAVALVAKVGGREQDADPLYEAFEHAVPRDANGVGIVWQDKRGPILMAGLKARAGSYRLLVHVLEGAFDEGLNAAAVNVDNPAATLPGRVINAGAMNLSVTDKGVTLGGGPLNVSVPQDEDRLTLRLDIPSNLKQLSDPSAASLPVDDTSPLNLYLQQDGSFRGSLEVAGGGGAVQVLLLPVGR
ncbi:MAG: hypothetical protein IT443_09785 [Phycisphaeraceae bacterium]|nr:hypothetical protein [Phycisphaeraceae bacterium]